MATEEMKPETKRTEQKQKQKHSPHIKEDLPPPILPPLPLPYKSCSLKVSIHCEGCKTKVKKVLTTIEGVYKVDIDVKQHKVTVIGIIPPEILLKKLHKAGKNAELLPEISGPVENKPKPVDPNKKNKKVENVQRTDEATTSSTDKPEKIDAGKCVKPVSQNINTTGECGPSDSGENAPVMEEKKDVPQEKESVKEVSLTPPADPPGPAAEKKGEETGGAGKGKVGKKKKKKAQNLTTTNNPTGGPARTKSAPLPATADHDRPFNEYNDHSIVTNNTLPHHDMYHYPPPGFCAPQVMYGVSYNVAQPPLSVDTASSYYTPPPPYSYAYMHPGYQPSNHYAYSSRSSDSFELFNDENPNGCVVM